MKKSKRELDNNKKGKWLHEYKIIDNRIGDYKISDKNVMPN
jgi:hypothetical protein